jgi:hypothetical protein
MIGVSMSNGWGNKEKKSVKKTIYRSSKTGRIVTAKYAKQHPATTEKEKVNTGKKGKK